MLKSLLYKEWIKTRWFVLWYLIMALCTVSYIFITVQHDLKFFSGEKYWNGILFQEYSYYKNLKFIPLLGGIILGIAQYIPEIIDKRIKLSFHLPISENKILLQMITFGALTLTSTYCIIYLLFISLSHIFFSYEIIEMALIDMTSWFLSGYTVYFLIALIVLEPTWKHRLYNLLVSVIILSIYFTPAVNGAFAPVNWSLLVLTSTLSLGILFSGYRFRKGHQ